VQRQTWSLRKNSTARRVWDFSCAFGTVKLVRPQLPGAASLDGGHNPLRSATAQHDCTSAGPALKPAAKPRQPQPQPQPQPPTAEKARFTPQQEVEAPDDRIVKGFPPMLEPKVPSPGKSGTHFGKFNSIPQKQIRMLAVARFTRASVRPLALSGLKRREAFLHDPAAHQYTAKARGRAIPVAE
jgi:hypothetical protein